jgi:hypothetical protein
MISWIGVKPAPTLPRADLQRNGPDLHPQRAMSATIRRIGKNRNSTAEASLSEPLTGGHVVDVTTNGRTQ